jgi:hypothetical protein
MAGVGVIPGVTDTSPGVATCGPRLPKAAYPSEGQALSGSGRARIHDCKSEVRFRGDIPEIISSS